MAATEFRVGRGGSSAGARNSGGVRTEGIVVGTNGVGGIARMEAMTVRVHAGDGRTTRITGRARETKGNRPTRLCALRLIQ